MHYYIEEDNKYNIAYHAPNADVLNSPYSSEVFGEVAVPAATTRSCNRLAAKVVMGGGPFVPHNFLPFSELPEAVRIWARAEASAPVFPMGRNFSRQNSNITRV